MTGSGRPFAMQTRVTLLPSFTVMSEEILEIFGGTVKTKESWTLLLLEDSRSDLLTCLLINQRQPRTPLTGCAPHYYLVFWTVSVLQVQGPGFSVDKKINSSATTFWWCRHVKKRMEKDTGSSGLISGVCMGWSSQEGERKNEAETQARSQLSQETLKKQGLRAVRKQPALTRESTWHSTPRKSNSNGKPA